MTKSQLEKIIIDKGIGKFELKELPPRTVELTIVTLRWWQFGRKRKIRELRKHIDVYCLPVWLAGLSVITHTGKKFR